MEKYYRMIEEKIKASGYPGHLDGEDIYNDICDQMEDKEAGTYLLLSKSVAPTHPGFAECDEFFIEYLVDVMEAEFNLSTLDIHTKNGIYHVGFDA